MIEAIIPWSIYIASTLGSLYFLSGECLHAGNRKWLWINTLSFIPVVNSIVILTWGVAGLLGETAGFKELKEKYNEKVQCRDCEMSSYRGRSIKINDALNFENSCQFCGSDRIKSIEYEDDIYPVVKKMNTFETMKLRLLELKLVKTKANNKKTMYQAEQLAKYNQIQEIKLQQMKGEK